MRTVRNILTVVFSFGFLVAQIPSTAQCQMGLFSPLTLRCNMPCCKKLPNTARCPMVKKIAPRDTIASATPQFNVSLKEVTIHQPADVSMKAERPRFHTVAQILQKLFLLKHPLPSRAPPADVVTLQA